MGYFLSLLFLLLATPAFASYNPGSGPGGGVSSVTGTSPISVTAGTTPVVSIAVATCAADGVHALTNPSGIAFACTVINAGSGTVTSVGFATNFPGVSVSGSPVTTAGTGTFTLATQAAHLFLAGPTSGSAATPTWRALVAADLPLPTASTIGGVQSKAVVASTYLTGISPVDGSVSAAQINYTDLQGTPPTVIDPVTQSVGVPTTLSYSTTKSMVRYVTFTASTILTIPSASYIGQHLELYLCQDASGGRVWQVAPGSGVVLRGVFPTPDTTPNLCMVCGLSYPAATNTAFLTNPGCTVAE